MDFLLPLFALVPFTVSAAQHPSIQEAIDALEGKPGTVMLAARTYTLTEPVRVPSGVTLLGTGPLTILRLAPGADVPAIVNAGFEGNGDTGIRLERFTVDGHGTGQTAQMPLIYLDRIQNAVIRDLTVRDGSATGLELRRASRCEIVACRFLRNGATTRWVASGINLNQDCHDNRITHNVASHNNPGRTWVGVPHDGNGIRIGDHCRRNQVRFNTLEGNGRRGVKVQGAENQVTDNVLLGNGGHSLLVGGLVCTDNLIARNRIAGRFDAAIHVTADATPGDGTFRNRIEANRIEAGTVGIQVGWGAWGNSISNNRLSGVDGHGIYLRGTQENRIDGNTIAACGSRHVANAIQIANHQGRRSTHNRVERNRCSDPRAERRQGFGLKTEPDTDYTVCVENDFRKNRFVPALQLGGPHDSAARNRL